MIWVSSDQDWMPSSTPLRLPGAMALDNTRRGRYVSFSGWKVSKNLGLGAASKHLQKSMCFNVAQICCCCFLDVFLLKLGKMRKSNASGVALYNLVWLFGTWGLVVWPYNWRDLLLPGMISMIFHIAGLMMLLGQKWSLNNGQQVWNLLNIKKRLGNAQHSRPTLIFTAIAYGSNQFIAIDQLRPKIQQSKHVFHHVAHISPIRSKHMLIFMTPTPVGSWLYRQLLYFSDTGNHKIKVFDTWAQHWLSFNTAWSKGLFFAIVLFGKLQVSTRFGGTHFWWHILLRVLIGDNSSCDANRAVGRPAEGVRDARHSLQPLQLYEL